MPAQPDDWRRMGQEDQLRGAHLTWKRYQALRVDWEHEHCVFCTRKFLDEHYSDWAAEQLRERPDQDLSAGYTTPEQDGHKAGDVWICADCFEDFRDELAWVVSDSDPEGWPYPGPEPSPRPTAPRG
jgi:hypothetical protein